MGACCSCVDEEPGGTADETTILIPADRRTPATEPPGQGSRQDGGEADDRRGAGEPPPAHVRQVVAIKSTLSLEKGSVTVAEEPPGPEQADERAASVVLRLKCAVRSTADTPGKLRILTCCRESASEAPGAPPLLLQLLPQDGVSQSDFEQVDPLPIPPHTTQRADLTLRIPTSHLASDSQLGFYPIVLILTLDEEPGHPTDHALKASYIESTIAPGDRRYKCERHVMVTDGQMFMLKEVFGGGSGGAAGGSDACVICLTNAPNVLLFPCRHQCLCLSCVEHVMQSCPLCRATIDDYVTAIHQDSPQQN
ncbi:putative E3 ubiquitin-protein ligase LUL4 [Diplonema papillatum]|nr:putative E3 ubiquitin-protein ligase LUL4 [Diplonema papillatum]